MNLSNDSVFGVHTLALDTWSRRTEVLSSNLANADTPGYLARDVDFKSVLAHATGQSESLPLTTTSAGHMDPAGLGRNLAYRVPNQPSMDGNTVDTQVEQANFAGNTVHYQASLAFITAEIKMLRTAAMGGQG